MGLESATHINQLNPANPDGGDSASTLDQHDRMIKLCLVTDLPNIGGVMTRTHDQLNDVHVTQALTDNSTKPASTAFVQGLIATVNAAAAQPGRNKIQNGLGLVSQRGASVTGMGAGSNGLDRWYVSSAATAAQVTMSQSSDAPASAPHIRSSIRVTVTTADASIAAGDLFAVGQTIEGFNARALVGRDMTLSFWVRSAKTGVHSVALSNSGSDRTYVGIYTVNAADTWEFKTITVVGGLTTAGTWDYTTGAGLRVRWALAAGSTFQTTASAWQNGNFGATSAQPNVLDTAGNIFAISGVQLEVGAIATPFEYLPIDQVQAQCERYLPCNDVYAMAGQAYQTNTALIPMPFRHVARVSPTGILLGSSLASYTLTKSDAVSQSLTSLNFSAGNVGGGQVQAVTAATNLIAGDAALLLASGNKILWTGVELQ